MVTFSSLLPAHPFPVGDHFYKENRFLSLEEQMITAMPEIRSRTLAEDDEFIVVACDGIWLACSVILISKKPVFP